MSGATIIRADARSLPLADASVDLIVTSPPYFALRSYSDGGEHYAGQVGSEPTPAEFIEALLECTREMVRVLKPTGSIWVNLGDKYAGSPSGPRNLPDMKKHAGQWNHRGPSKRLATPSKSLLLLPERYRIACVDELGLIARAVVIWSKPNGLPESVTDRVRRSHEDWVHLTKQPRYFAAVDEIRQPYTARAVDQSAIDARAGLTHGTAGRKNRADITGRERSATILNPLGALPGSVWEIATQPLTVPAELGIDHFAAFPMEWPRRIILGWSPRAVCVECGFLLGSTYDSGMLGVRDGVRSTRSPRRSRQVLLEDVLQPAHGPRAEVDDLPTADDAWLRGGVEAGPPNGAEVGLRHGTQADHGATNRPDPGSLRGRAPQERGQDRQPDRESGTAGEGRPRPAAQARAEAVSVPALRRTHSDLRNALACPHCGSGQLQDSVIVDPFGGTGTTALLADVLGRHGISVDMSADYCRLAEWRTTDPGELAKAMQVEKPPAVLDGQLSLLDLAMEGAH